MTDIVTRLMGLADEFALRCFHHEHAHNRELARQALEAELVRLFTLQPKNWTVFNSGAQVVEVETFAEAWDYMTEARIDRGWTAVCVVDKSNMPHGIGGES